MCVSVCVCVDDTSRKQTKILAFYEEYVSVCVCVELGPCHWVNCAPICGLPLPRAKQSTFWDKL